MLSLSELRGLGRQAGLKMVAATPADFLQQAGSFLQEQLQRGIITPWTTGDIALRCHPARLLAGARSVVVAALPYRVNEASLPYWPPSPSSGRGRISRCSWGRDYHVVLHNRLHQLAALLASASGSPVDFHVQVDNGPLVERALAARAGLGFIGKNCSLIVPPYGSWVFLGLIVTTLEIQPGEEQAAGCGSCTRCLESCPTGALEAPYRLRPSRCLSYVSQAGGDLPDEMQPLLDNRLYGCDTCQEACPYNAITAFSPEQDFWPTDAGHAPLLGEVLQMQAADFQARWGKSALAWRGLNILARNAAIALVNTGNPAGELFLRQAVAAHSSPLVRRHAARGLAILET